MRRATITLSDELEAELEEYLAAQEVAPSLTSLVQAALRSFLADRLPGAGGFAGPAPPSEVAEVAPAYGAEPQSPGSAGPGAWGTDRAAPRLRDLPDVLSALPRLSEPEARDLAGDLERARGDLDRLDGGGPRDPWSQGEPEPGAGAPPEPGSS